MQKDLLRGLGHGNKDPKCCHSGSGDLLLDKEIEINNLYSNL